MCSSPDLKVLARTDILQGALVPNTYKGMIKLFVDRVIDTALAGHRRALAEERYLRNLVLLQKCLSSPSWVVRRTASRSRFGGSPRSMSGGSAWSAIGGCALCRRCAANGLYKCGPKTAVHTRGDTGLMY